MWILFFYDREPVFHILIWIALGFQTLALIWAYRNLHESPAWLISNGYNKKLFRYFEFLAKYNKQEAKFDEFVMKHNHAFENKDVQVTEVHSREDSFKGAIINNRVMRKNFILMTFFWLSVSSIYFIMVMYPRTYL